LTANELLALLGRAWPRLLIYPGGLAAFALIWLMTRTKNKEQRTKNKGAGRTAEPRTENREPGVLWANRRTRTKNKEAENQGVRRGFLSSILYPLSSSRHPFTRSPAHPLGRQSGRSIERPYGLWSVVGIMDISALALPWLALALLPLPRAAGLSRSIDLVVVLVLLEWPLLLTIAAELRASAAARARAARRLASALNSYPPLILAALLLASAYGSLDTTALTRTPDAHTPAPVALLYWLAAGAWLLALPPVLGIGVFAAGPPDSRALWLGLWLRKLGLVALATLPWFPLVARPEAGRQAEADLAWLGLPLPPLIIAALLWGYSRLTVGRSARSWARAYLVLDAVLLLLLLWAAYTALQARLA
jgi:hypothetical protein